MHDGAAATLARAGTRNWHAHLAPSAGRLHAPADGRLLVDVEDTAETLWPQPELGWEGRPLAYQ